MGPESAREVGQAKQTGGITDWLRRSPTSVLTVWATTFAFLTYFSMYAFRKPFSVATFSGLTFFGTEIELKTAIVLSQIIGYTVSKFMGIKYCSELSRHWRAPTIVSLIATAEITLVGYGLAPGSWKFIPIFANGMCLGMIWGVVVSYLEGRKTSEILLAGLSCSYIVSSGIVKDIGRWLLSLGVSESWMPAATGSFFLFLLVPSVWMLDQIPDPDERDVELRSRRLAMLSSDRGAFMRRFLGGMVALTAAYFFLTAYRDFRDLYGQELFEELGYGDTPGVFSMTEIPIAIGVMVMFSLISLIQDPRRGMMAVYGALILGAVLIGGATALLQFGAINGLAWMIVAGLGAYIAYVPYGSVLFDRIIAATRFPGTAVFAIYLSDAVGYTGSVGLQLYKDFFASHSTRLQFFVIFSYVMCLFGLVTFVFSAFYFDRLAVKEVSIHEAHEIAA